MSTSEEYWMGKGLDLDRIWTVFDGGTGYINKVSSCDLHLLRLTFGSPALHSPLFSHEAIYKTIKGTFHDVKMECYSPQKYNELAPIFLYRVDRGSGIYDFLAQLGPLLTWVLSLGGLLILHRKLLAMDQDFDEKNLKIIQSSFPDASPEDRLAYMKARTTSSRRKILLKLLEHDLNKVELSKHPVSMDTDPNPDLVDMAFITMLGDDQNPSAEG